MTWFDGASRRKQREEQLDAELRFDYEQRIAQNITRGMSDADARRAARLEFGGIEQVKEECRDTWGIPFLRSLAQDVRYAVRGMSRAPGFTAVAIITLAVGIGVNTIVFTIVNAHFKRFRLVKDNERLLYLDTQKNGAGCCVSYPDFQDWRLQAKSFQGLGAFADTAITLVGKDNFSERLVASRITANTFALLGQRPILGRDFVAFDEMADAPPVAILAYSLWERRFGKDPAVIGQTLQISGDHRISTAEITVIGVMAKGFSFPQNQDLWLPLVPTPDLQERDARSLWFAVGRLAHGATNRSARVEMETIGRRLASTYPVTNQGTVPVVHEFGEFFFGKNAITMYRSIWGAGGFVLMIACANLANLLLARASGRSREISVRIALGAGRWRIIRQLLLESLVLSGICGIFGLFIAQWGVRIYESMAYAPWSLNSEKNVLDYALDYRVLAYLVAISTGAGILFGLAPALRLSKLEVSTTLKDGGQGTTGGRRGKQLSFLFVAGEMGLAIMLLAGAGLMIRSFLNVYTADIGIRSANILTMRIFLPVAKYSRADAQISFFERLKTRLAAVPGVESVAITSTLPATGTSSRFPHELADSPLLPDGQHRPTVAEVTIGPDYFQTLRSPVLSGREFNGSDRGSAIPVAIVNQPFAGRSWPGEDPLGRRFRFFDGKKPQAWMTVVGVVSNIVQDDRRQDVEPLVYIPHAQRPAATMWVVAQTHVPSGSLGAAFRRELHAIDSDVAFFSFTTLDEQLEERNWGRALYTGLLLIFAVVALLLASVGLYAVTSHSVRRRTQEIGIRMAIGATSRDVLRMVLRQGITRSGVGLAIGLIGSLAVNRLLKSSLVGVSPTDPVALASACGVLIAAALLGCWIPARRAARTDPANVIRYE